MTYNKGEKMSSIEALKRIKRKYKYLIVKELHRSTHYNNNINIENIEEYWHKENKEDFSQIEKDLEILEILKNSMSVETVTFKNDNEVEKYEYEYIAFNDWNLDIENKEDYNKIRKWLIEK